MEHKILNLKLIVSAFAILLLSLINTGTAFGYEDNQAKKISVDKKVREIGSTQFYDNIEASQKMFFEGDVLEFQINVHNVGPDDLYNINVKDMLPKNLSLIFYPGKFESDQRIVEWDIDKILHNQSKTFYIRAKISDSTKLNTMINQVNKAEACGGGQCDNDTASYVIGRVRIPATGNSDILVKSGFAALIAGFGFFFRKKSRGY